MNIAITNGLLLMPPAFHAGLTAWSSGNGTSGSPGWANAPNAGIVPGDQDFGSCLEILKEQTTTRLRFRGETPMIPGVYLRVSARLKTVAGAFCSARIAGWAGDGQRNEVTGLVTTGPTVAMENYGEIIEISAIVGVGARQGVNMAWGTRPVFGHFGLDLVGANGGAIRIESIRIEDVTSAFIPSLIDWVDVRDFGAVGDGVTNDRAAFLAADQAANGGGILVPEGTFFINGDIGIEAPIRFKGTLRTPAATRVSFMQSFDFPTYADAFGDETLGMKKALQALLGYTDHVSLDLCGRRVDLTEPLDIAALAPNLVGFSNRRVIMNGSIKAVEGPAWNTGSWTSRATYNPNQPLILSDVVNIAAIEVGSRVSGNGVGREVYVRSKNVAQGRLTLSQPLYGGAGTRVYSFQRYRYLFDFSGVEQISRLNFVDLDFNCGGFASTIMLPAQGEMIAIRDCYFTRPKDRGITSIGRGCQDLLVDRCQFLSNEMDLPAQQRNTIAINVNANDVKMRNNRFVRFAHFMVANGGGHIISGNHWFQGDGSGEGLRYAGLVLTQPNVQTTITGNYIDNASIEWTNEHSARPNFTGNEFSFGGLTITGNTFLCSNTASWFTWITLKPHGSGHFIHGLTVAGNVFKALYGNVARIDRVDTSIADLDYNNMRNVQFEGNMFNGIDTYVANPLMLTHTQATASNAWTIPVAQGLPFQGWTKSVQSVVAETQLTSASGAQVSEMPWVQTQVGASNRQLRLNWSTPVRGRVAIFARMDRPQ
ncbi:glycosyl hydrolase family 28-related protein [Paracoccus siganidrum]|uniref:Right-handed parallel beta-helix repeat-containing protein n=1 Tax=Paracoccus siganidrum TaxID=1276757 RepID=A0A419A8N4_9RHOB|nr:glycosyl hydrolase family 28-related protein [Paracoccus siganidrum]RJL18616.1 right-handed parallel beta-helix repeat-containing protein [Paracoccus siganidrum]RMC36878.1 right-handed parallel beta-helix repeat-containing protein [Paracoccus siganidrum]